MRGNATARYNLGAHRWQERESRDFGHDAAKMRVQRYSSASNFSTSADVAIWMSARKQICTAGAQQRDLRESWEITNPLGRTTAFGASRSAQIGRGILFNTDMHLSINV
jgi:hypothetical protein